MINIFYRNLREKTLKEIPTFKVGSWVHAQNPTPQEIQELVGRYRFDKGLLEDALDPYEVPRIEKEDTVIYIYTRFANTTEDEMTTKPILIAIGDTFVATVVKEPAEVLALILEGKTKFYTTQKTKCVLQILLAINAAYTRCINKISKNIRGKGFRLDKITEQDITDFVLFENILNDFLSALIPTNNILEKLMHGKYLTLYEDDKDLIEDLALSNGQLMEMCRSSLKSIVNIRDAHTTIATNELNRVMKILTAITAILTIPTIIASIYGMNVNLPMQNSPIAFSVIVGSIAIICFLLLIIFVKNKLL